MVILDTVREWKYTAHESYVREYVSLEKVINTNDCCVAFGAEKMENRAT